MKKLVFVVLCLAGVLLAACGRGGQEDAPVPVYESYEPAYIPAFLVLDPPPALPLGAERIVFPVQVDRFVNTRGDAQPTNGLIADLVREYIIQLVDDFSVGFSGMVEIMPFTQRRHDDFLAAMLDVWDDDPATGAFAVNRYAMAEKFDEIDLFPITGLRLSRSATRIDVIGNAQMGLLLLMVGDTHTFFVGGTDALNDDDIDNIVRRYLVNLFYWTFGFGEALAGVKADLLLGERTPARLAHWDLYTGFFHQVGELAGFAPMFAAASYGNEFFTQWVSHFIAGMNPLYDFDYRMLRYAKAATTVLGDCRDGEYFAAFGEKTGVFTLTDPHWWTRFGVGLHLFYFDDDESALQLNEIVRTLYNFAQAQNIEPLAPVNEPLLPLYDSYYNDLSLRFPQAFNLPSTLLTTQVRWGFVASSDPLWEIAGHFRGSVHFPLYSNGLLELSLWDLWDAYIRYVENIYEPRPGHMYTDLIDPVLNLATREALITGFWQDSMTFPFTMEYLEKIINATYFYFARDSGVQNFGGLYVHRHNRSYIPVIVTPGDAHWFTHVVIHEIAHALALGETLAELFTEIALNSPHRANNFAYNSTMDRSLLRVLEEQGRGYEFWEAAFHSNERFSELWDEIFGHYITSRELQWARGVYFDISVGRNFGQDFALRNSFSQFAGFDIQTAASRLLGNWQIFTGDFLPQNQELAFERFRAVVEVLNEFSHLYRTSLQQHVLDNVIAGHVRRYFS